MQARSFTLRVPLLVMVAACLAAWSGQAGSQGVEPGARCVSIGDDSQRLACYDEAFGRARRSAAAPAAVAAPALPASPTPAASAAALPAASATAPTAPAAATPADPGALESDFGAEDLPNVEAELAPELDSLTARVVEVVRDRRGRHLVRLDNGQAWRQVETTQFLPAEVDDEVKLWRGAFDAYRLRRTDGGRTVTVRRVE